MSDLCKGPFRPVANCCENAVVQKLENSHFWQRNCPAQQIHSVVCTGPQGTLYKLAKLLFTNGFVFHQCESLK